MPNRNLSDHELQQASALLNEIREKLLALSAGDSALHFAFRRKVYKELSYDERDKPMVRRRLKALKWSSQNGLCAICREPLPDKYTVLDRLNAVDRYAELNTRLLCPSCDVKNQQSRGYA